MVETICLFNFCFVFSDNICWKICYAALHDWKLCMSFSFLTGLGSAGVSPSFQNPWRQSRRLWKPQREWLISFCWCAPAVCCEPPGTQPTTVGKHQYGGRGHVQTQRPAAPTGWVAESPAEGERVGPPQVARYFTNTCREVDRLVSHSSHRHLDTGALFQSDCSILLFIKSIFLMHV